MCSLISFDTLMHLWEYQCNQNDEHTYHHWTFTYSPLWSLFLFPRDCWSTFLYCRLVCIFEVFKEVGSFICIYSVLSAFSNSAQIFWISPRLIHAAHSFLLLGSSTLCSPFTTHLLIDIWIIFSFWLLETKSIWPFMYKSLNGHMLLSFWINKYLGVERLDTRVNIHLTF